MPIGRNDDQGLVLFEYNLISVSFTINNKKNLI